MTTQSNASSQNRKIETITLGAGCFWCVEAIFQRVKGVTSIESGYSGGKTQNPTYTEISSGTTGHAEVVQISFDTDDVSIEKILEVFWKTHNPTTLNQQGADVGTQYRSVIFFHTENQRQIAQKLKELLSKENVWDRPIVTEITPYTKFYKAENYHQNYFNQNKNQAYCQFVIVPKLEKFEKIFKDVAIDAKQK